MKYPLCFAALSFALASISGCFWLPGTTGGCEAPFYTQALPTGMATSSDGRYSLIGVSWFYRKDSCSPGRYGGALHVVDTQDLASTVTLDGLPTLTGPVVAMSGEFIALPATYPLLTLDVDAVEYLVVDSVPPFTTVTHVPLPDHTTGVVSASGRAVFLLPGSNSVLVHEHGAPDTSVSVVSSPRGIASISGLAYVSGAGGVSEIDPVSKLELRRIPTCDASGPITSFGPHTLAVACVSGGAQVIDIASVGTPLTIAANSFITRMSGSAQFGVALVSDVAQGSETRVFTSGAGARGSPIVGALTDEVIFTSSSNAFVVTDFAPGKVDLSTGALSPIPNFFMPGSDLAQLDRYSGNAILLASGAGGLFEFDLFNIDVVSGAVTAGPYPVPTPSSLPLP